MKKTTLAALASAFLISAYAGSAMSDGDHTHVHLGSSGTPVMTGNGNCLHTGNTGGTIFAQCGGDEGDTMAAKDTMAQDTMATKPAPRVITKVVVDCTKCN